jgi:hypothetical protein
MKGMPAVVGRVLPEVRKAVDGKLPKVFKSVRVVVLDGQDAWYDLGPKGWFQRHACGSNGTFIRNASTKALLNHGGLDRIVYALGRLGRIPMADVKPFRTWLAANQKAHDTHKKIADAKTVLQAEGFTVTSKSVGKGMAALAKSNKSTRTMTTRVSKGFAS